MQPSQLNLLSRLLSGSLSYNTCFSPLPDQKILRARAHGTIHCSSREGEVCEYFCSCRLSLLVSPPACHRSSLTAPSPPSPQTCLGAPPPNQPKGNLAVPAATFLPVLDFCQLDALCPPQNLLGCAPTKQRGALLVPGGTFYWYLVTLLLAPGGTFSWYLVTLFAGTWLQCMSDPWL